MGETGRDRVLQVEVEAAEWGHRGGRARAPEGAGRLGDATAVSVGSDPGVSRRGSGVSQDGARDTSGWDQGVEPVEGEKVVGPGALHSADTAVLCGWSEVL